jgi:hypothetical protein
MQNYPILDKWQELYTATLVELPMAAAQLVFSGGRKRNVEGLVWSAYESWLWLANETANRFFGASALRSMTPRGGNLRLVDSNPSADSFLDSWPHAGRIEAR